MVPQLHQAAGVPPGSTGRVQGRTWGDLFDDRPHDRLLQLD
jgi:hypothetical protein